MATRKQKSRAEIRVADGTGRLRAVADHRFRRGPWPIQHLIAASDAETYMAHLNAEMVHRGWSSSGLEQLETHRNSGSKTLHLATGAGAGSLDIVWDKARGGELHFKARSGTQPPVDASIVQDFFAAVDRRVVRGPQDQAHCRLWLTYHGLPWKGEIWLSPSLRLGPPSRFADSLLGEQVVIVDAMVTGIGAQGVRNSFERLLTEIALVLSPILGVHLHQVPQWELRWIVDIDDQGKLQDCRLGHVGYTELSLPAGMPSVGDAPPMTIESVMRPGLGRHGIWPCDVAARVPADLVPLWNAFVALPTKLRQQYLCACNAYSLARSMWPVQRTAYAVFLVIACEALKPASNKFDKANIYDITASLTSKSTAKSLQRLSPAPYKVRSGHVHRGELAADELAAWVSAERFIDPSFDETLMTLSQTARICLIEWLRRAGVYQLVWMPRPAKTARARSRSHRRRR